MTIIIQNPENIFPFDINPAIFSGITAPLNDFGIIRARGADAASFVHGQLSQDFSLLKPLQAARLAAFCSPKGRVLANFIGIKLAADDILLLCAADVLAATLKRLRMFVLRAKCELSDASADFTVRGAAGAAALAALGAADMQQTWELRGDADSLCIALPAIAPIARALVVCANVATSEGKNTENLSKIQTLSLDAWRWLDTASGCATVRAATSDAFVPQMLNYESLGGVNFKKGCYPGQEVVARSQFRGAIKRRTFVAKIVVEQGSIDDFPPNTEVFTAPSLAESEPQPSGALLQTAPALGASLPAIAQIAITAADAALPLTARNAHGQTAQIHALGLPYLLQEDI